MPRYPSSNVTYAIGPGGISPAVKLLLITNVVLFFMNMIVGDAMTLRLGLSPQAVFEQMALWQPVTYMFLHSTGGIGHILFNMLALWMFGTDLERTWGTRFFTKYYFITGIGAAATTMALGWFSDSIYYSITVGASGAIYGLLVAYAIYFPHRTIYYIIFPIPARVFVIIAGAIAFLSSMGGPGGGVAHAAHLGGLVVGYLYLKGLRLRPLDELKYRYLRWKMGRARNRFDVYSGGRSPDDDWKNDWKKHIH
ncbi:MAG TPA: rhomboid family intramembrane serine protease [Vicinamibacterales bacterium]|nr:rhomboid family intramembrane serine protease [Vicinamibacterales bacterium]